MPRIVAPSSPLSTNSSRAAFRSKSRFASLTAKDQSCGNGIRSFFIHNNVIDWVLYVNRAPCAIANWRGGFSRWIERFVRASARYPKLIECESGGETRRLSIVSGRRGYTNLPIAPI